ncbi:MAG: hypothetical protein SO178_08425 [Floccifex porci]|nr:hypothetical protein [Floccifex porci]MDY4797671.1 hypothetical protein [Floccifex porci]
MIIKTIPVPYHQYIQMVSINIRKLAEASKVCQGCTAAPIMD